VIESKKDRAIEMKNGVVCHSVGLHAACSDEGFMENGASKYSISQFWAGVIAVIGGNSSSSTPLNSVMNSVRDGKRAIGRSAGRHNRAIGDRNGDRMGIR
jgi:hypothetical protein